ncbi:MAG: hypothetical protein K9M98_14465, partial [Cephaloticoccus sp.]|nr:hypothetical protein [Cephaloticoccus sp.]
MNCTHAQERLTELLDPRNATATTDEVRQHLTHCPDCQREFSSLQRTLATLDIMPNEQPSPRLRANFYAMLEEEKHSAASAVTTTPRRKRMALWSWILSPLAACGLLALGFVAGQRSLPATAPVAATDITTQQQLAALQRKVDSMDQAVKYSLLQQQPAGERLKGVLATQDLKS